MKQPQSYQLLIQLTEAVDIVIGKLGRFHFAPGVYCYTGSAKKNLAARMQRHQAKIKKMKWHIDYLLTNPQAVIIKTIVSDEMECILNQQTAGSIPIPGFGASDCRNKCGSHLKCVSVFPTLSLTHSLS